ncbi:MAG: NeuD/PglB/VioB family sugar acetyltransferase [Salinivirgaceae bacterium]|nr:NeuD/PglB/VioB family sugar acetyltransferase [Salinivirgaceae bacterium]
MKNIVLFGGGVHASYCIDIIKKEGKYNIVGIIDSINNIGEEISGYSIIGRQEEINILIDKFNIDAGVITIGDNWSRKVVFDCIKQKSPKFKFVNAIHPSTIIGMNVKLGVGIVIMAGCIINPNSIIGDFCFFATGAQIEHDNCIGDFASISAGSITGGKVKLGKFSAITLGVTVMDRLSIGENTVVGAGSLVTKDIADNVLAYGIPAKIIRSIPKGYKFLK